MYVLEKRDTEGVGVLYSTSFSFPLIDTNTSRAVPILKMAPRARNNFLLERGIF